MRQENREAVQKRVYTVTGQELPEEDIDQLIATGKGVNGWEGGGLMLVKWVCVWGGGGQMLFRLTPQ